MSNKTPSNKYKEECGYCVGEFPRSQLYYNTKLKTLVCRDCYDELQKQETGSGRRKR
ncbi:hypothetical protein AQUSIP_13220 [Aquicella siphonis]|uniref:Uncharacterized protein n=1 Tax=Aquicella siphonis TaxID=254247 RepID=A0A5E4PI51_9COXI|nr:hypothetical protein AQUSIP_13220 [Aquicella siphonis]